MPQRGSREPAGWSKRSFGKAAASEAARRTLRYVEPLSDARTKLTAFFNILLEIVFRPADRRKLIVPFPQFPFQKGLDESIEVTVHDGRDVTDLMTRSVIFD